MTTVILDTNVIFSALRSKRGASAKILSMVATARFDLCMSITLALEYEDVLKRDPDRINLSPQEIDELISFLCANSIRKEPRLAFWPLTDDPGDEFIARLAMAAQCDFLVTHNVRHFRDLAEITGISVVTPARFLAIIGT